MIKSTSLMVHHGILWDDYNAVIETSDGSKYSYALGYNKETWTSVNDYLEDAKSDFQNEDPENTDSDLFEIVEDGYFE